MKTYLTLGLIFAGLTFGSAAVVMADSDSYNYDESSFKSEPTKVVKKAKRAASSESQLSRDDAEFAADYKKREAKEGYVADRDCSCRGSAYCSCAPSAGSGYGYWDGGYGGYGYGYGSGFGSASGPWSSGW